ncbi:MAG: hypothetical protein QG641_595 [Candidatus Poribacteria bacterium]|nr:hypothetical protein [Candidatus Poribacteria bacterium]
MLKVVEGIYKDGNVKVKIDELPDVSGAKAIVIFVRDDMEKRKVLKRLEVLKELPPVYDESAKLEISEKESDDLFTDLKMLDETELKTEQKPFRIIEDGFFAMPPEHLGKTSASDLDKILADEAMGIRKWKKYS